MQTMDRCILKLFREQRIAPGTACSYMRSGQALNELRDLTANRANQVLDVHQRRYISTAETASLSTATPMEAPGTRSQTTEAPAP
jgi:hypothetical protein